MAKPFNTNPLSYEWTEKAFDLLQQGKLEATVISKKGVTVVRVYGVCPYCEDQLHYSDTHTAITEGSEGVLGGAGGVGVLDAQAPEATYEEFTVTCGCSEAHDGDPNKGTGCGTSFKVSVLVP